MPRMPTPPTESWCCDSSKPLPRRFLPSKRPLEEPLSTHPYKQLSDKAFWRRSVGGVPSHEVDPVGAFSLRITPETKVATAGSCFAQHIARHLRAAGFNYYVVEPGHPILPTKVREKHNY